MNVIFQVDDEPYCLWEVRLKQEVGDFLSGFDTEYFDHLLKVHFESDDEKRAAVALRVAYHHAMETLFLMLGAFLQAPAAPHAWLAKCSNAQLRNVVRRISAGDDTLAKGLSVRSVNWTELASASLHWYKPGTNRQAESIKLFSELWRSLAAEFLEPNRVDEYNSLKHGLRVSGGGFGLSFGVEHEYGVPPPENEMRAIEKSEFGTTFLRFVPASGRSSDRSLVAEQVSINWKIEKVAPLLQLTSISIANVIGALRVLNGYPPDRIKFLRPEKDEAFTEAWKQVPAATHLVTRVRPGADVRIFVA